jgi:hypothetical protein
MLDFVTNLVSVQHLSSPMTLSTQLFNMQGKEQKFLSFKPSTLAGRENHKGQLAP